MQKGGLFILIKESYVKGPGKRANGQLGGLGELPKPQIWWSAWSVHGMDGFTREESFMHF